MSNVEFELKVSNKYQSKYQNAKTRGLDFTITLTSMRNMLKAKRCYYTGILMTEPADGGKLRATDRTIDRIDSTKGYVPGNVVACCNAANTLKNMCEGGGIKGYELGARVLQKTIKHIKKGK
tara:strand:- start:67 stop:432 length:366 start_codon:yes stop_codon:yes gene_type:complete